MRGFDMKRTAVEQSRIATLERQIKILEAENARKEEAIAHLMEQQRDLIKNYQAIADTLNTIVSLLSTKNIP